MLPTACRTNAVVAPERSSRFVATGSPVETRTISSEETLSRPSMFEADAYQSRLEKLARGGADIDALERLPRRCRRSGARRTSRFIFTLSTQSSSSTTEPSTDSMTAAVEAEAAPITSAEPKSASTQAPLECVDPTHMPDYFWGPHIAAGSYGKVFKLLNVRAEVSAIAKVPSEKSGAKKCLQREAQVLARLTPHPTIVGFRCYHRNQVGTELLVLDYAAEGNVRTLANAGFFNGSPARVRQLAVDVLSALSWVHDGEACAHYRRRQADRGERPEPLWQVVHRDIKEENVLYNGNKFLVADWGLAKLLPSGESGRYLRSRSGSGGRLHPGMVYQHHRGQPYDAVSVDIWLVAFMLLAVGAGEDWAAGLLAPSPALGAMPTHEISEKSRRVVTPQEVLPGVPDGGLPAGALEFASRIGCNLYGRQPTASRLLGEDPWLLGKTTQSTRHSSRSSRVSRRMHQRRSPYVMVSPVSPGAVFLMG